MLKQCKQDGWSLTPYIQDQFTCSNGSFMLHQMPNGLQINFWECQGHEEIVIPEALPAPQENINS